MKRAYQTLTLKGMTNNKHHVSIIKTKN